jgi:hypothetical protein
VLLKFDLGEAFQFDWSEEGLIVGDIYRRMPVRPYEIGASRAFWLVAYPNHGHEQLFDAPRRIAFGAVRTGGGAREQPAVPRPGEDCYRRGHRDLSRAPGKSWPHLLRQAPLHCVAPAQAQRPLQRLRQGLMRRDGGDKPMAQVLNCVASHGLKAVLVAVTHRRIAKCKNLNLLPVRISAAAGSSTDHAFNSTRGIPHKYTKVLITGAFTTLAPQLFWALGIRAPDFSRLILEVRAGLSTVFTKIYRYRPNNFTDMS